MKQAATIYADCIIIGGGAAGLMCAATAGKRGKQVLVLEGSNKVGKKILMSGGGRCNFTNYEVNHRHFLTANPHFCKSALSRYTPYDFIALVDEYGLAYHEKTLGQLFCDHSAKDVLNILLAECNKSAVKIELRCTIQKVMGLHTQPLSDYPEARFAIHTENQDYACHSLIIATGGLSVPTLGASGLGYEIAKQFALPLVPRDPALVPLILPPALLRNTQALAGVALPVSIQCQSQTFSESLLFTHKGISGPAVLQISSYWQAGYTIEIDFLPHIALAQCLAAWRQQGKKVNLKNGLSQYLPSRFVEAWLALDQAIYAISQKPVTQLNKADIAALEQHFHAWRCQPLGTEGYQKAEVTRGGVDTAAISSKTFEAKSVKGLYFIGEVLDVTGWLGGYNFQWAWASGYCAGQAV